MTQGKNAHHCNRTCVCECGRPMMYDRRYGHRCADLSCSNARRFHR